MQKRELILPPNLDVDQARYSVMARLEAPRPDWMRDRSLLPKKPPGKIQSNDNGEE